MSTVTVVGLGPGGDGAVTAETLAAIERITVRFLRTARHPSAHLVPDATTFDDVYETADRFDDVYAEIVERLVAAAAEHGEVLYAVPGSPLVLERSVRMLRDDGRVTCDVLPALSFLDVAWARLGIDPVEAGVRLVDGHEFATAAAGHAGPLLSPTPTPTGCSPTSSWPSRPRGDEPVTILQRLGTDDERITETTWSELDRTVEADHLTCVYVPHLGAPVGAGYVRFHQLTRTLREQCPWDREQTHRTLAPYLVEETFELVDALEALDPDDPATDAARHRGARRPAVPDRVPRHDRRAGGPVLDRRRHRRRPRQAGAPPPARVRRRRRRPTPPTVLPTGTQIKRDEKGRTSVFDGVADVAAGARLRPAAQTQGGQGRLRLARRRRRRWPRSPRSWPSCAAAIGGDDGARSPTSSATCCSPSSTSPATPASTPSWRCARRAGKFRRRFEAVEALGRRRDIDLRAADLATLDALWDEVRSRRAGRRWAPMRAASCADPRRPPRRRPAAVLHRPRDWDLPDMHRGARPAPPRRAPRRGRRRPAPRLLRRQGAARTTSSCASTACSAAWPRTASRPRWSWRPSPGAPTTATACWSPATSTTPLPYRVVALRARPAIPYLGDRLLDALVGLLVRLHLAGFFWGDCSLSNTLFRRDAGALSAYVIDTETSRALPQPLRRTAGVRPADRHRERRRRAARPAGRRAPRRPTSTRGTSPSGSRRATRTCGTSSRRGRSSTPTRPGASRSDSSGSTPSASTSPRWTSSPTRRPAACGSPRGWSRAATTRTAWSRSPGCGRARTRPDACSSDIRNFGAELRRAHRRQPARERGRRALARPALRADDQRRAA